MASVTANTQTIVNGVVIIVVAGLIGAAVRGIMKFFQRISRSVETTELRSKQLETNDGHSLRDAVNQIHTKVDHLEEVTTATILKQEKTDKKVNKIVRTLNAQNITATDRYDNPKKATK